MNRAWSAYCFGLTCAIAGAAIHSQGWIGAIVLGVVLGVGSLIVGGRE